MSGSRSEGRRAFAQSERTRPSESLPSSVVRSMHDAARRIPAIFALVLMDRFARSPARVSSITASTTADICRLKRSALLLFLFYRNEQRFKVPLAETERPFALNDLEEHRRAVLQ